MATFNPYLNFKGNAEEAFNFYKSVFGGEFLALQRYGDMPGDDASNIEVKDKILHISLPVREGGHILMASDAVGAMGGQFIVGNNVYVAITAESEEEAYKLFNGLSAGGSDIMPLQKMFWGALYSHFTDKFGIHWMVSFNEPQAQQ